jgi:hypothetical protein
MVIKISIQNIVPVLAWSVRPTTQAFNYFKCNISAPESLATLPVVFEEILYSDLKTKMDSTSSEISAADQKVLDDLNILLEKIDQCQTKLGELKSNATAIPKSNELYDIVGFLEACAPRMVELVELKHYLIWIVLVLHLWMP